MNPEHQNARPGEPGTGRSGERSTSSASARTLQDASNPQLALTKLWLSCGPRVRREFLADIIASDPALWREVTEGAR